MIAGDALWEDGFGFLNPGIDGPQVFEEAKQALDTIEALQPTIVIPGHGRPFGDVSGALQRAKSRLAYLEKNPMSMCKAGLRAGLGFWTLANPAVTKEELCRFLELMERHSPELFSSLGLSMKDPEAFLNWLVSIGALAEGNGVWSPGKALDGMDYSPKVSLFSK